MKNPITAINLVNRNLTLLLPWRIHVGIAKVVYYRAAFNASLVLSLPLLHELGSKSPVFFYDCHKYEIFYIIETYGTELGKLYL